MATFEYSVTGQSITTTKAGRIVSGTVGVYTVKFTFDSSWDGLEKWASFDPNPGQAYKQPLDANGECEIPGEVMGGVQLRIGAFGLADGQAYPTVWANKLSLEEGCFVEIPMSDWPEPAPVIEGILEELENKVDKPASATAGNVAIFDNNENIADSGVGKDNLILSPQLNSHIYAEDQTPYIYRQTGGGVEAGTREYDSIVGGSVVNHQYVKALSSADWRSEGGVTVSYSADNEATVSSTTRSNGIYTRYSGAAVVNHIYYLAAYLYSANTYNNICFGRASGTSVFTNNWSTVANTWKLNTSLRRAASAATSPIYFYCTNTGGYQDVKVKDPMIIDLTEMLGSTVAEYLFTNEHPYAILQKIGLNQYRPYTAEPSLLSAMPTAHKTVGFNRFDKTKVSAGKWLSTTTGLEENSQSYTVTDYIRVFGGVPVYIPNTDSARRWFYSLDKTPVQYLAQSSEQIFTPPTDGYIRASIHTAGSGAKNLDEICINISDPVRNGTYEPYEEHTYPLAGIELRGVPAVDSGGNIYFDGDTYAPDGTVTRRYGIVDLGTLTWNYTTYSGISRFYTTLGDAKKPSATSETAHAICPNYLTIPQSDAWVDGVLCITTAGQLNILDNAYSSAAAFKAAMSGVNMFYELATPTVETATPYDALQICDPLGTEEYVDERSVPVPVGHVTKYPVDQVRKLDGLPNDFSTLIAPTEKTYTATRTYAVGRMLIVDNQLYKAQTAIASGATLTVGTNIAATTLDEVIASL